MRTALIKEFDPWKSEMCTCPKKYSLNPYTGCEHLCLYCYSTYIPKFWNPRPKKNFEKVVAKDLERIEENAIICLSNSSDPYQRKLETIYNYTRNFLRIVKDSGKRFRIMIVTKSDLVVKDLDLIKDLDCVVAMSITGKMGKHFELNVCGYRERVEALKKLSNEGVKIVLRLDPLIPFLSKKDWLETIEDCNFVNHITTSTLKLKRDAALRICKKYPELKNAIMQLYFKNGEKVKGYRYLKKEIRKKMLKIVEEKADIYGISCGFCREGFPFKAKSCDGSHLFKK